MSSLTKSAQHHFEVTTMRQILAYAALASFAIAGVSSLVTGHSWPMLVSLVLLVLAMIVGVDHED